jgi:FkbM family methyltransferase
MLRSFRRTAGRIKRYLIPPPPPAVTLAKMFGGRPAVIVQVGSNDGLQGDPIADLIRANPAWRVLFIEPLPHVFRRLMANYPELPNYSFENVAISWERGIRRIYYVSDDIRKVRPDVPFWYDQLGSFDRNHLLKHGNEFEPFITSEGVRCEPLADTLARNSIIGIDLLHIDTEGYDFEVIKQLDLTQQAPGAILYEHKHLSDIDKIAVERLLRQAGYRAQRFVADTLALRGRHRSRQ